VTVWTPQVQQVVAKATRAMKWFLDHGGNIDIADGDGVTVRGSISRLARFSPEMAKYVKDADHQRAERAKSSGGCCGFCWRQDAALLKCGKCKAVRYCPPGVRTCQKDDWPHHKKGCRKPLVDEDGSFSFLGTKFPTA
jgi:hypothetical protein